MDDEPSSSKSNSQITEQILFTGRVQGVGFRYTTRDIAKQYPIVGYVQNLPDGRVELLAQGAAMAVVAFVEAVATRFRANLRGIDRRQVPPPEDLTRFEIRF